jgi:hypothetical protein
MKAKDSELDECKHFMNDRSLVSLMEVFESQEG